MDLGNPWTIESARAYALEVGDDERAAGALNDALSWALDALEATHGKIRELNVIRAEIDRQHEAEMRRVVAELEGENEYLLERDELRSLLGWRPIETAPKDGTRILGWAEDCPEVIWWDSGRWWNEIAWRADDDPPTPTHWRPIGPGPEGK